MRSIVAALLYASVAVAQPGETLTPIALDQLPGPCLDLGKLASSVSRNQALSARIALASCVVDQELKSIALCDCEQAVHDVDGVVQPSLRLLDEVVAAGDPATQILARHAQGELLAGLARRILASVPPPANDTDAAVALHELRLDMVQPLVDPWLIRARAAFAEVDRVARANPQLAKNPAVVAAVRDSRGMLRNP